MTVDIQNLTGSVQPLELVNKTNEIIDAVNDTLNMYYATTNPVLTPTEGVATWTVTHNLNSEHVTYKLYLNGNEIVSNCTVTSANVITVSFYATTTVTAGSCMITVIANGASDSPSGGTYTLPVASTTTLGGVKVDGTSITISDEVISANINVSGKEDTSNKVTSLLSSSTDTEYPSAKCVYDAYSGYQTIQDIQILADGTITLNKTNSTYYRQPAADTTFIFNLASGTVASSQSFTFELYVYMPTTVYSLIFPNTLTWQNGEIPDVTEVGLYRFAFQTLDAGTTWNGNLQGKW